MSTAGSCAGRDLPAPVVSSCDASQDMELPAGPPVLQGYHIPKDSCEKSLFRVSFLPFKTLLVTTLLVTSHMVQIIAEIWSLFSQLIWVTCGGSSGVFSGRGGRGNLKALCLYHFPVKVFNICPLLVQSYAKDFGTSAMSGARVFP